MIDNQKLGLSLIPSTNLAQDPLLLSPTQEGMFCEAEYMPPAMPSGVLWAGMMESHNRIMSAVIKQHSEWGLVTGKMEESINNLNDKIALMMQELEQIHSTRTFVVPLSAPPRNFKMIHPIPVTIEGDGEDFIASFTEANVSASGETEADALANLKDSLTATYDFLESLSESERGPLPARQWETLSSVLER